MFDLFSWSHILILLVVALVVVGPKDLPRLMNMAGRWAGKARSMAAEFRRSFDEMARESELAELRKEIEDLKNNNPVSDIANSLTDVQGDLTKAVEGADAAPQSETMSQAVSEAAPENGSAEPRSGEFEVTSTTPEPASAPASSGSASPG
jgi:sec-independent protein translocase protein TatB